MTMNRSRLVLSTLLLLASASANAGQAPFAAASPDFPVSERDRVYAAEQFSNTISVIDPSTNKNLGVIRLGDSAADEPIAALQGPGPGPRARLLAGSSDACGRVDR